MGEQYFTPEEANALLPQVAPRMERALQLHAHVRAGTEELAQRGYRITPALLSSQTEPESEDKDGRYLLERTRGFYEAMTAEIEAIRALGAEVKGVEQGLVDFHSWLDGETEVLLCWKLGENRIAYYHDPEAGFAGRQPIEGHEFTKEPRTPRSATSEHS